MPGLVRSLLVAATVDGLILQPLHQRSQRSLHINYATHEITYTGRRPDHTDATQECHGAIGLLNVPPLSFLITITHRRQVAEINGLPVFVICNVSLIPLSSRLDATKAIQLAKTFSSTDPAQSVSNATDSEVSDGDEEDSGHAPHDDGEAADVSPVTASPAEEAPFGPESSRDRSATSNIARDVLGSKGQYGRFAEKWFSKKGWSVERRRVQGMSIDDQRQPSAAVEHAGSSDHHPIEDASPPTFGDPATDQAASSSPAEELPHRTTKTHTLLPKLLRTTRLLFSSQSFFFSYDLDITRRAGYQPPKGSDLPLIMSVDPLFFWNQKLADPFINGGFHSHVLPVMQGFVGQRSFRLTRAHSQMGPTVQEPTGAVSEGPELKANETQPNANEGAFLLTLISRRSVTRPGLRYLRRGVDEDGDAANFVETEQILCRPSSLSGKTTHSFTQIRGSIPLFFSQSPYAFKPIPLLQHSGEANRAAFERHFDKLVRRYGDVHIVLLVDKVGVEKPIGDRFKALTAQVNDGPGIHGHQLGFEWFDFHEECRGMRFENVSRLMATVGAKVDGFGATRVRDGEVESRQTGVARTNCMDCLDRTNVVQAAFGQRILEAHLRKEGYAIDLETDDTTQWFNTLWADNGDAISKQYSSTAALKGDYTRTRQRNYRGAINDLGLTLSRYYNNLVNDYFSQAAIDFLLGKVTAQVFEDFEENMMSRDPSMSIQKIRQSAINSAIKIAVADSTEDLIGAWILYCPREPNTVRVGPLEEAILLLTDAALYKVSFNWESEKVSSFVRVDLRNVSGLIRGTYITSTLTASQRDEARNVGVLIRWDCSKEDVTRVNTRSLSSVVSLSEAHNRSQPDNGAPLVPRSSKGGRTQIQVMAFKALPSASSETSERDRPAGRSERQEVTDICDSLLRAVETAGLDAKRILVSEEKIVSLEEAQKGTGLIEQWSHSLKRLVWG